MALRIGHHFPAHVALADISGHRAEPIAPASPPRPAGSALSSGLPRLPPPPIDRLQAAGHVYPQPSPADRRKVEIRVSQQAIALGWGFFGPLLTGMIDAMRDFGPGELDTVERFLREVAAATRWPGGQATR